MKGIAIILLAFMAAGCGNQVQTGSSGQSNSDSLNTEDTLCFLRTDGSSDQDSTKIRMFVNGDSVNGIMNWLPYEKDSRTGTLKGRIADGIIKAQWVFMQEGMRDSLGVEFKLEQNTLIQKKLVFDPATGRERTDENGSYDVVYKKINCN